MAYAGGNQALPGLNPVSAGVAGTAPRVREYDINSTNVALVGEGCLLSYDGTTGVTLQAAVLTGRPNTIGVAAETPRTGATKVKVYDDPEQEFVVISDGTITTTVAANMVGLFTAVVSNTRSATTGRGKTKLDISAVTSAALVTQGDLMQIVRTEQIVGQSNTGTATPGPTSLYAQIRVKIAKHAHNYGSSSQLRNT